MKCQSALQQWVRISKNEGTELKFGNKLSKKNYKHPKLRMLCSESKSLKDWTRFMSQKTRAIGELKKWSRLKRQGKNQAVKLNK